MTKIKLSALYIMLVVAISLTSCSSDDDSNDTTQPVETSTGDYWPMALNNSWTMSSMGETSIAKIVGIENFGGINYYEISDGTTVGDSPVKQWIAKNGATYYQKIGDLEFSQEGISIKMKGYEMAVLKDNLPVGGTWSNQIKAEAEYFFMGETMKMYYTIDYRGTILEKGISATVNGKNYSNVIKMNLTQEVNIEGEIELVESDYWYAEGVGPIKYITRSGGETIETILIEYIINK